MMRAMRALAIGAFVSLLGAFLGTFIYLVLSEPEKEDDQWRE